MKTEAEQYCDQKGWKYSGLRRKPGWIKVVDCCPFCETPGDLYIDTGTGRCWCRTKNAICSFLNLKVELGDARFDVRSASAWREQLERQQAADALTWGHRPPRGIAEMYHRQLGFAPGVERHDAMVYLMNVLGLTQATLRRFMVGCDLIPDGETNIGTPIDRIVFTVPHMHEGEVTTIHYWKDPINVSSNPEREFSCVRVPFNADCLKGLVDEKAPDRRVMVTGDEWSAMALAQLGFPYVVACDDRYLDQDRLVPDTWPQHWTDPFLEATSIILCHDATETGQQAAARAARILGGQRCTRIIHPSGTKSWLDANGAELGVSDVEKAIDAGEKMRSKEITVLADYADELEQRVFAPHSRGYPTGWYELDSVWGGVRPELSIVTGGTGDGKSTWTTALAYSLACQGIPVLSAQFELSPVQVLGMLVSMDGCRSLYGDRAMSQLQFHDSIAKVSLLPFYLLDVRNKRGRRKTSMRAEEFIEHARYAIRAHGVRFIVLDHLRRFLSGRNQREELDMIGPTMEMFADFTEDAGTHLMVVAQPKTIEARRGQRKARYSIEDIWGGSKTTQEVDSGLVVNRIRDDESSPGRGDAVEVAVEKCRSQAGSEGVVRFIFDPAGLRYMSEGEHMVRQEERAMRDDIPDINEYRERWRRQGGQDEIYDDGVLQ